MWVKSLILPQAVCTGYPVRFHVKQADDVKLEEIVMLDGSLKAPKRCGQDEASLMKHGVMVNFVNSIGLRDA
jgi:hypothetical protein